MADQAEQAFLRVYINTLVSQPVTYTADYQQPPENCLRKVPVLHVSLPPPPPMKQLPLTPSAEPLTLTFKSLKPPVSYTIVVHLTDTIAAVKALLAAQPSGPPVETQRLLLKGKALADVKLLKEYSIKDGDTVNLALKTLPTPTPAPPMATESASAQPPSLHLDPPAATQPRKHQRIPSVVLSPSPSSETPGAASGGDIMLTLDAATESLSAATELSSYHATIAQPEYWERLLAYLRSEFKNDADAQVAFEDYLRASKGSLTAHEIAKIRDHVGVIGMAGT
ncbi:hypothetical protein GGX14DRAFT_623583, partial [Mycena pura]